MPRNGAFKDTTEDGPGPRSAPPERGSPRSLRGCSASPGSPPLPFGEPTSLIGKLTSTVGIHSILTGSSTPPGARRRCSGDHLLPLGIATRTAKIACFPIGITTSTTDCLLLLGKAQHPFLEASAPHGDRLHPSEKSLYPTSRAAGIRKEQSGQERTRSVQFLGPSSLEMAKISNGMPYIPEVFRPKNIRLPQRHLNRGKYVRENVLHYRPRVQQP